MNERPVLKVELVAEDVALEQLSNLDPLLEQLLEIMFKKENEDVRVLVLLNVLNNFVGRRNLVANQRDVQCGRNHLFTWLMVFCVG